METAMRYVIPFAALSLMVSACNPAPAHQGMKMQASSAAAPVVKTGTGTGDVKAVDTKAGTVTLDHEAMPAIGWPAMTMTFPVSEPSVLNGLEAGKTVSFDVTVTDNKPVITDVRP
jgi:Cu(I)/Ag(I) efflux system protein CusF